jgi:Inositol hexakisphosphate
MRSTIRSRQYHGLQELSIYIAGRPYTRREADMPTVAMHHAGIHWRELQKLEQWLREDARLSVEDWAAGGELRVLVHREAPARFRLRMRRHSCSANAKICGASRIASSFQCAQSEDEKRHTQLKAVCKCTNTLQARLCCDASRDVQEAAQPAVPSRSGEDGVRAADASIGNDAHTRLEAFWECVPEAAADGAALGLATAWQACCTLLLRCSYGATYKALTNKVR